MKKLIILSTLVLSTTLLFAQNQIPQLLNVEDQLDLSNQTFTIEYNLSDAESDQVAISLQYSIDNAQTFTEISSGLTGDVGFPVSPDGNLKSIIWNYAGTNLGISADLVRLRLIADDQQAIDISALINQVDTNRLKSDFNLLDGRRHRTTGSTLLRITKDTLEQLFNTAGLSTNRQEVPFNGYTGENIIGSNPGISNTAEVYIIDAHFDTVNNSPGADDNASGTIGVMEACRILGQYAFNKTVKFIGFDLEESGLIGSSRYVSGGGIQNFETINGVINFEMIGYYDENPNTQSFPTGFDLIYPDIYNAVAADSFRGNFITNIGNNNSSDFMMAFDAASNQYVPDLSIYSFLADAAGFTPPDFLRSDHAAFWLNGHKALMITNSANFRNPNYHTLNDVSTKLNIEFMSNVIKAAIATLAEEAGIRHASQVILDANTTVGVSVLPNCDLNISPNPAHHNCTIQFDNCPYQFTNLEVFNMDGKKVYSVDLSNKENLELQTQGWHTGVYILRLNSPNGFTTSKLVIDQ